MLDQSVLQTLKTFLKKRRKRIGMVWFGTPCTSWSLARRNDGGPPLRDDADYLWSGLPGLSHRDQQRAQQGNLLLLATVDLIHLCNELHLVWAMENPFSSRLWKAPPVQALLSDVSVELLKVDYCAYGTPWRKSTGILTNAPNRLAPICRICMPRNGRCQYSGHRHFCLTGKDASGMWLTLRAQPYPRALCEAIARQFAKHYREHL